MIKKIITAVSTLALVAGVFAFNTVGAADSTVVVSPGDMQGWGFVQETATGSGEMVEGPSIPFEGTGSANFIVDSAGGEYLGKAHAGTPLTSITNLEYSTYRASGGDALAVALQLNVDSDLTDANNAWQGRLVYEPYHTQDVETNMWQTWDPLDDTQGTATGNWFFSNATLAAESGCSMAYPCIWAEVLAEYPNAGIHNTLGAIGLKAGGSWAGGFNGNVDGLTIGISGDNITYDFELEAPAEETVTVTIVKYIDGEAATAESADNAEFPMYATWNDGPEGIPDGEGPYELSNVGFNNSTAYYATTSEMASGADYATNEVTGGDVVAANCADGDQPFALAGYKTGADLASAEAALPSTISPAFTDLEEDMFVIVLNVTCEDEPPVSTIPTNKDQCKNGGYATLTDQNGVLFKNQGQCVSFVNGRR